MESTAPDDQSRLPVRTALYQMLQGGLREQSAHSLIELSTKVLQYSRTKSRMLTAPGGTTQVATATEYFIRVPG